MWCWLFHQKFWGMYWAEGDRCAIHCDKCKRDFPMDRMDAVNNQRIRDTRQPYLF